MGKECEPNVVTYTCLIQCFCQKKRIVDALGMLDRMEKRGIKTNRVLMRIILNGFCIDEHSSKIQGLVDRLMGEE